MTERIQVVEKILNANDQLALENHKLLDEAGIYSLNFMASPGAGKTSLIEHTINRLSNNVRRAQPRIRLDVRSTERTGCGRGKGLSNYRSSVTSFYYL